MRAARPRRCALRGIPRSAAFARWPGGPRGDPTRVKALGALIGDGLESIRQIRLLDEGAHRRNCAVGRQEGLGRRLRTPQDIALETDAALQALIERKTVARQANRGLQ